jgi:hypothetical protein
MSTKVQAPITVKEIKNATAVSKSMHDTSKPEQGIVTEGLSWTGKLFFAGVASYLAGSVLGAIRRHKTGAVKESDGEEMVGTEAPLEKPFPFKIKGTPQQIQAVTEIIMSSKEFQDELKNPGATVDSVIQKLNLHDISKKNFKNLTGHDWPLP